MIVYKFFVKTFANADLRGEPISIMVKTGDDLVNNEFFNDNFCVKFENSNLSFFLSNKIQTQKNSVKMY